MTMKKTFSLFLLCLTGVIFAATPVFQADYEENFTGQSRGKAVEGKVSQELLWETLFYNTTPLKYKKGENKNGKKS